MISLTYWELFYIICSLWKLKLSAQILILKYFIKTYFPTFHLALVSSYIFSLKMLRLTCTKRYCCDGTPVLLKFHQSFIKLNIMYNDMTRYKTDCNNIHCWSLQKKINWTATEMKKEKFFATLQYVQVNVSKSRTNSKETNKASCMRSSIYITVTRD